MGLAAPRTPGERAIADAFSDWYDAGWEEAMGHALEIVSALCPEQYEEFQRRVKALSEPPAQDQ